MHETVAAEITATPQLQRACDAVNQGGTADKKFYSSLTESIFLSGTFFMQWKHSLVPVA